MLICGTQPFANDPLRCWRASFSPQAPSRELGKRAAFLESAVMLSSRLVRGAYSVMSTLFGGLGVYFLCSSFADPAQIPRALIFLGSAISIVWSLQQYSGGPTTRR